MFLLVFLPVKQDPLVGGKPPRSPILSRRSHLSSIRGRRVGGHVFIQPWSDCAGRKSLEIHTSFTTSTSYSMYSTVCSFSYAVWFSFLYFCSFKAWVFVWFCLVIFVLKETVASLIMKSCLICQQQQTSLCFPPPVTLNLIASRYPHFNCLSVCFCLSYSD